MAGERKAYAAKHMPFLLGRSSDFVKSETILWRWEFIRMEHLEETVGGDTVMDIIWDMSFEVKNRGISKLTF